VQKYNVGHLNKLVRYKTLKSLRSYLAAKGKKRVKAINTKNSITIGCCKLLYNVDTKNKVAHKSRRNFLELTIEEFVHSLSLTKALLLQFEGEREKKPEHHQALIQGQNSSQGIHFIFYFLGFFERKYVCKPI
jgi:hypothetical protein